MDVMEALRQMRISLREWDESEEMPDHETQAMMFEHFRALDEWMSKGGFSPWEIEVRESLHSGTIPPAVFIPAE
jgi:hypothetical protein